LLTQSAQRDNFIAGAKDCGWTTIFSTEQLALRRVKNKLSVRFQIGRAWFEAEIAQLQDLRIVYKKEKSIDIMGLSYKLAKRRLDERVA
jgi:epoxyqueuosine reductase QueG